jgi:hypothetical protein
MGGSPRAENEGATDKSWSTPPAVSSAGRRRRWLCVRVETRRGGRAWVRGSGAALYRGAGHGGYLGSHA